MLKTWLCRPFTDLLQSLLTPPPTWMVSVPVVLVGEASFIEWPSGKAGETHKGGAEKMSLKLMGFL